MKFTLILFLWTADGWRNPTPVMHFHTPGSCERAAQAYPGPSLCRVTYLV